MGKNKRRKILTTSSLPNKKVVQEEPTVEKTERGEISFEPHQGQGATKSGPPEEAETSISGTSPRSLPSPWNKRFVVIIAAWNCKKWIGDCLATLSNQTLDEKFWGVLILDDASEDGMERICRKRGAEHIRVKENRGKSALLNLASKLLDPETVIVELDADDGLDPRALVIVKEAWDKIPEAVLVYTQYALCLPDMSIRAKGHCKQAGTSLSDAGYISHLKTYRAQTILDIGFIDEHIRKSTDKVLTYRLQELAEETGRPLVFVDEVMYWYRRRMEGSITKMRQHDATEATRNAYKRRTGIEEGTVCVYSGSPINDTGGPGIFWTRLFEQLSREEDIHVVDDISVADVVLGNIHLSSAVDHQRPWVTRLDGVHFNSKTDYHKRNQGIIESVNVSEGMIYQSKWGKEMADEYCGVSSGEATIIPNGVVFPEDWEKAPKKDRKVILACSRWGDSRYARKFKRLEATIEGFEASGLGDKGYKLVILGQHYLNASSYTKKSIVFKGRVPSTEVHGYLRQAAVFVHLSWLDCCPNGVVEALAAKVPILYCADGVDELVGEHAGVRVLDSPINHPCDTGKPPRLNPQEIADRMVEMVSKNWDRVVFPDVSMKTCGKRYADMIRRVNAIGVRTEEDKKVARRLLKPVVASTEDMK